MTSTSSKSGTSPNERSKSKVSVNPGLQETDSFCNSQELHQNGDKTFILSRDTAMENTANECKQEVHERSVSFDVAKSHVDSSSPCNDFDSSHSSNLSALDIEKAKVSSLSKQLLSSINEKKKLQASIEKIQNELEKQIRQNIQMKKRQISMSANGVAAVNDSQTHRNREKGLEIELISTQKELSKEISNSQRREEKIRRLMEKCKTYDEDLETMRKERTNGSKVKNESLYQSSIKNLEHQRSELLGVIKKQTRLIEILKQQRVHAEAASRLARAEQEFMTQDTKKIK
ncbi:hypothetical protein ACHAXS_009559 [Conticribra weissflogii]